MTDREKAINDLNTSKLILCNPQMLTPEMCVKIGQAITSAIALLKEQEAVPTDTKMTDINTVMGWLEGLIQDDWRQWHSDSEVQETAKATLELLKEQKPILLENQHKPYGHVINANSPWISRCPKCGKKIEGKQTRYCKYCGQAVKWE